MDPRTVTGLLGLGAIVALLLVAMYGFFETAAFNVLGEYANATFASAGVVVAFVAVLSVLAIRADVRGRNPYW